MRFWCGTAARRRPPESALASTTGYGEAIRSRVVAAINEGDLVLAAAMAETPEQRSWVRDAERQAATDAAGVRAEVARKRQIRATLDANAAADRRAKQPKTCYGTPVSFGNGISSTESTRN